MNPHDSIIQCPRCGCLRTISFLAAHSLITCTECGFEGCESWETLA